MKHVSLFFAKTGQDPSEFSSYRSNSLLNVDVKILAKVLARRLDSVLPSVISGDQTGFIENRRSYIKTHCLFDIIYCPSDAVPECVLLLDAEKALSVTMWSGCTRLQVLKNSQPFHLQRGTRQRFPLSPLLFDLAT